mmetsp:Transcript_22173/g.21964  ORF Transcript_22173/g.21964 Transcript_22173/m.21964 type:complete len:124 (+) Transcript_22173:1269-1640(+)
MRLKDQCDYLMMKENKLKYFYDTLNSAVYPVQELYDNTIKNIPTTRFYEFLESQNKEGNNQLPPNLPGGQGGPYMPFPPEGGHAKQEPEQEPEPIKKSEYSFHLEDSYEDLPRKEVKDPSKPK